MIIGIITGVFIGISAAILCVITWISEHNDDNKKHS